MGNKTTQPPQTPTPEGMGQAVQDQSVQAWVASEDLKATLRSRVSLKDAFNIFSYGVQHILPSLFFLLDL
jgi:hypothetical protein